MILKRVLREDAFLGCTDLAAGQCRQLQKAEILA
jgi:hypothetical protein